MCEDEKLDSFSEWQLSVYAKVNAGDMLQYDRVEICFSDKKKTYETEVWID